MRNTKTTTKNSTFAVIERAKIDAGKCAKIGKKSQQQPRAEIAEVTNNDYYVFKAGQNFGNAYKPAFTYSVPAALKAVVKYMTTFKGYQELKEIKLTIWENGAFDYAFTACFGYNSNTTGENVVKMQDGSSIEGAGQFVTIEAKDQKDGDWLRVLRDFDFIEVWTGNHGGNDYAVIKAAETDDGADIFAKWAFELSENGTAHETAPEAVEAVAKAPAAKVAAMEAPKGDNTPEIVATDKGCEIYFDRVPSREVRDALKSHKFRWHGIKKCWYGYTTPEKARAIIEGREPSDMEKIDINAAKKASDSVETCKGEPVAPVIDQAEGSRDFEHDIKEGDVVRIEGVEGTTGKTVNGVYYVSSISQYTDGTAHYWLKSLKKANGSIYEGIGKRSEAWPLHCYANNPKVCQEYRENVKNARLVGLGPVSLSVYMEMYNELQELEASKNNYWGGNPERLATVSAIVARMASENTSLETVRKWRENHPVKLDGPGLRITKNGLDVREVNGTWTHYALDFTHYEANDREPEHVMVWGSYYGHRSSRIPGGFAMDIKNNSDSYTDYFEADRAMVTKEHPLFNVFKAITKGGKAYTLTDSDAEALKAYTDAKKAAAEAKKAQEEEERAARYERQEAHAREVIAQYIDLFPGDAYHPHIIVQWSELGAMHQHAREDNENGATVFSIEAWENITGELDAYFKEDLGYNKTKFEFIDPINDRHFIDRCDLGDGSGSYGTRAKDTIKWCKEHAGEQYYMKDGGACCSPEEGASEAQMYLDCIPATFDELNAV